MKKFLPNIIAVLLCAIAIFRIGMVITKNFKRYVEPSYTESVYKGYEYAFNHSQYRQKKNPGIIPDETVYSYAAGAYLHGIDPILVNSERAPLGKYIFALSIVLFRNDSFFIPFFGLLTLVSVWLLGVSVLGNPLLAFIPPVILSFEPLFLNQLATVPLLDIVQLPFIFLSLYFFIREEKTQKFFITSIMIGLAAATKTLYTAFLLYAVFVLYFVCNKKFNRIIALCEWGILSAVIFCLSYTRTFISGYSIRQFLGFQKWILLYDQSKLLYPFSIWRLVFLNQWQAWWGDKRILHADDWQATWPLTTGLTFILGLLVLLRKIRVPTPLQVCFLWILVYGLFISMGISSSRFLLPFLPVSYIISLYAIKLLV